MSVAATPRAGDQATVSVLVELERSAAFDVFTREIDRWWRRGPKYRFGGRGSGTLCFETHAGGRLFESFTTPSGTHVIEAGRVLAWEPPARLLLLWRNPDFAADESTEVEVRFEPVGARTKVTVQHRGWAALRADHPARHGLEGAAFSRMLGLWWGELMSSLHEFVGRR
jgi:uncharacterized protein YndB with AHSA1/START domain